MKKIIFIFILMLFASFDAIAQNNSLQSVEKPTLPADFKGDGCTGFPDGNYADCCFAHDKEYYVGGSRKDRWRSDKKLFQCVASKPKFYNKIVAPIMWLGVRVGGVPWLKTPFRWGFGRNKKTRSKPFKTEQKSTN